MNLYKISQSVNNGYDTYDSAVVCAESEEIARQICPSNPDCSKLAYWDKYSWAYDPDDVEVEYIGMAKDGLERQIIVSSFNAG
jgi:hypothetical protein